MRVLREAQGPLEYSEIAKRILENGYYQTDGATPNSTVNAQISSSIKHRGFASPFVKVGKGTYGLRELVNQDEPHGLPPRDSELPTTVTEAEIEDSDLIVRSFGMYWQRDLVVWRNEPKLFGKQQADAKRVDFGKQRGIYILYDHHTVLYVGRSIDRPLGKRLYEHTTDRWGGRWNRFSWFGLLEVSDDGSLSSVRMPTDLASIIGTLEAVLIESLEPPQNRKRGDDLSGVEYVQDKDPELQERELQNTLRSIEQRLRTTN